MQVHVDAIRTRTQTCAARLLTTEDPTGLSIEIGERTASCNAFTPAGHDLKYVTSELGMGHLTFMHDDLEAFERYYSEGRGLTISDHNEITLMPSLTIRVGFYRANPRHHTVACATGLDNRKRLNHFMLEVLDRNVVGVGYERATKAGIPVAHRLGVHPNDNLFTFYTRSPSGFQAELGAEGRLVAADEPAGVFDKFSIWGHEMPLAQKARTFKMTMRNIARGLLSA